jgi:hypothetical protein
MPEHLDDGRELDRLWNDLIAGRVDPTGYAVDPASAEALRTFQALAAPPLHASRDRLDRDVLAAIERRTRESRPEDLISHVMTPTIQFGANGSGKPVALSAATAPRARWSAVLFAQLATAALVLLTLIGSYFAFGGASRRHQEEAAPVVIPAIVGSPEASSAAPAFSTTPLLEITLPAGILGRQSWGAAPSGWIFSHYAIAPDERITYPDLCAAPDLVVRYVLHGTYAVKALGTLQVIRHAADGSEAAMEAVAPRQDVTLHAGDALLYRNFSGDMFEGFRNPGPGRLELLEWAWLEVDCRKAIPSGMDLQWDTFPGTSAAEFDRLPFDSSRPLSFRLREMTAAPGTELPQKGPDGPGLLPPGFPGLEVAAAEQGRVSVSDTAPKGTDHRVGSDLPPSGGVVSGSTFLPVDSTRTIRSAGDEPLLLYTVTIVNTDDAAAPPMGSPGQEATPMR